MARAPAGQMQPQHAGGQGAEVPLQKASSERSHPLVLSAGRLQNRRLAFGIGGRGGYLRCKRRYLDAWRIERHGAACSQVGGRGRVPRFVSCCWFARVLGVPARPAAPPAARQPRAAARRCARAPSCAGTRGWGALLRRAHLEARSLKFEFEFAPRKAEKAGYALRYSTFPRRPSSRDVAACFPRLTKPLMSCEHQQTSSMAMGQVPRTLAVGCRCRIRDHIRAGLSVSRLDCRLSAKERPQP